MGASWTFDEGSKGGLNPPLTGVATLIVGLIVRYGNSGVGRTCHGRCWGECSVLAFWKAKTLSLCPSPGGGEIIDSSSLRTSEWQIIPAFPTESEQLPQVNCAWTVSKGLCYNRAAERHG